MKKYNHLFFDLDHTLWDYDANTSAAVDEVFNYYDFARLGISQQDFLLRFHEVNEYLWNLYNHGHIDRNHLRTQRFRMILEKLGFSENHVPTDIGEKYLEIAPSKNAVIDGTIELLEFAKPNYQMHIISNGFDDVQYRKLDASGILHYFDKVITSDNSGFRKPQKEIFFFALQAAGATLDNSLFIGDNPDTDIVGALNAGMDLVYFNPNKKPHEFALTYEVDSLHQIMNIL